ncbi:MAG: THUMP domain-containing protein [Chlamydiota bacterium]
MNEQSLFISCAEHLEPLLLQELAQLGIEEGKQSFRGVFIPHSIENIYKVNYLSRIATRVFSPLAQFSCPHKDALYHEVKKIDWTLFLDETKTFAIDANITHPQIRHSLFGAQVVKDAICDQLREKRNGLRPSIDVKNPDVQLNIYIQHQKAILSFDTSGAPLYKRGWKQESTEATLPETLAAAILMKSGYNGQDVLCDPFCGSGTFLIEAACIATRTPAGYFREKWGFFHHPEFRKEEWDAFKSSWDQKRVPIPAHHIIGADRDPRAIALCKEYLKKTGFSKEVVLIHSPITELTLPKAPSLIVTDPPFGKRLETNADLYKQFGQFLKKKCTAAPFAYLICPSFSLVKSTGCTILSEQPLYHGGLKIILFQVQI